MNDGSTLQGHAPIECPGDPDAVDRHPLAGTGYRLLLSLLASLLLSPCFTAEAQEQPAVDPVASPSLATEIEQHLARVQVEAAADPAELAELTERLREALALVAQGRADRTRAESLGQERVAAPQLLEQLQAQIRAVRDSEPGFAADTPVDDAEVFLSEAQGTLSNARELQTKLRTELETHLADRLQIGARLAEARAGLEEARQQVTALSLVDPPTLVSTTAYLHARARVRAMESRIALLDEQRTGFDIRESLLSARIELQRNVVSRQEQRVALLQRAVAAGRDQRARAAELAIAPELLDAYPALAQAAANAREWTTTLAAIDLSAYQTRARADLLALQREEERLTTRFVEVRTRLERLGRSEAAGILLRAVATQIPDLSEHRAGLEHWRSAIDEVQLLDVRLGRDIGLLEDEIEALPPITSAEVTTRELTERERAERQLHELDEALLTVLRDARQSVTELLGVLLEAAESERRMLETARQLGRFVQERQLWVPNAPPVTLASLAGIPAASVNLLAPQTWMGSLAALGRLVLERPLAITGAILILLLATRWIQRAWRYRERLAVVHAAPNSEGPFPWPEAAAAWLMSIAGPVIMTMTLGWLFASAPAAPVALDTLGSGLQLIADKGVFAVATLLTCYGTGGPVQLFAGWPAPAVKGVHHAARVLIIALPLSVMARILGALDIHHGLSAGDSAARLVLVAVLAVVAAALHPILVPQRGVIALLNPGNPPWIARGGLRALYLASMASLTALAYVNIAGYLVAAIEFTLAIIWALALTALYAFGAAILGRLKAAAARSEEADARERRRRIGALQVLLVITYGAVLLYVLRDLLPALRYLESINLWQTMTDSGVQPVTAARLLGAIIMLVATVILAWLVPSLLGVKRLTAIEEGVGGRYASAMLARYSIAIVGTAVALSMLSIEWSKIQWLLAGLSVGLGFGLQESVANFISGLMLLSERPIRVGDMVSVGEKTGIVSQIRMRATTIRVFDGRELIVPNKELVTTQVTNWTLTDASMRMQLVVGVAYGSDTALVERLLLDAAKKCPWVLSEPTPRAIFELFGDNSLQFRLFAFVSSRQYLLDSKHWLHMRIDRDFREHGIEIAFPQRDVHLDSRSPVEVRIVADSPPVAARVDGPASG